MTATNPHKYSIGTLILVLITIANVCLLVGLLFFVSNGVISLDQHYFGYMAVLVGSGIISSVVKLPSKAFNLDRKVALAAIPLLILTVLAVFSWNVFSFGWQSTACIGGFGVAVISVYWIVSLWIRRGEVYKRLFIE